MRKLITERLIFILLCRGCGVPHETMDLNTMRHKPVLEMYLGMLVDEGIFPRYKISEIRESELEVLTDEQLLTLFEFTVRRGSLQM